MCSHTHLFAVVGSDVLCEDSALMCLLNTRTCSCWDRWVTECSPLAQEVLRTVFWVPVPMCTSAALLSLHCPMWGPQHVSLSALSSWRFSPLSHVGALGPCVSAADGRHRLPGSPRRPRPLSASCLLLPAPLAQQASLAAPRPADTPEPQDLPPPLEWAAWSSVCFPLRLSFILTD